MRVFQVGDKVYVKNHRPGPSWLPGRIVESTGPLSFRVRLEDERIWRCHQDHLRRRVTNAESTQVPSPLLDGVASPAEVDMDTSETNANETPPPEEQNTDSEQSTTIEQTPQSTSATNTRVYPKRAHVPPKHYEPDCK